MLILNRLVFPTEQTRALSGGFHFFLAPFLNSPSTLIVDQQDTPWSECASELYRPTDRPPLVDEVTANFLRIESATWST
jgi:hypothetical protein